SGALSMRQKTMKECPRSEFPDLNKLIETGHGEALPVAAERDGIGRGFHCPKRLQALPTARIKEVHDSGLVASGQEAASRAKCEREYDFGVGSQGLQLRAAPSVPYLHGAALAGRGQAPAVRAESDGVGHAPFEAESAGPRMEQIPRAPIPQFGQSV